MIAEGVDIVDIGACSTRPGSTPVTLEQEWRYLEGALELIQALHGKCELYIVTNDGIYIYGYAVAADTGGFIKRHPTGIDLFFDTESECRKFGVRSAEIYILE